MFDWDLSLWLCFICIYYVAISILIVTLASCDKVIFESSLYVICVYTLPNLKQSLKKSYFLEKLMNSAWMKE